MEFSRRAFLKTLCTGGVMLSFRASLPRAFAALRSPSPLSSPCFGSSRTAYPPLLTRFIDHLDPARDVYPGEIYAAQIQATLDAWSASLCRSVPDLGLSRDDLERTLRASSFSPVSATDLRKNGPFRVERRIFGEPENGGTVGVDAFVAGWAAYLRSWSTLETAEFEIFGLHVVEETPLRVQTDIRYDLVGIGRDVTREQRVGVWQIEWTRNEQQRWEARRWTINPELRSLLRGPGFADITGHCLDQNSPGMAQLVPGIDYWRTALDCACGIDVYGNHGIAVGDIDGSGYDSFYVCQPSGLPNRLYRNRGDGTFEDITDNSGTGILDGTASAIFADFQNRGNQDLLVVRTGGPMLFENMGSGRFEARPDAFHFARAPQGTFTSAAVADYNRDGYLDIYLCVYSYYQGLNQYQFPSPYYDAQNGPPNFLFRNRGDGTFEDVTASSGMDQNNNRFSFAAAWCDYDNDGWPDLYVANDFGRKNLYRNNGDGTFSDIAAKAGVEDYGPGMSVCWLDHDNDGLQDIYVANMWLPEGKRITADDRFLAGVDPAIRSLYRKHNAGNSLYRNAGDRTFHDETNQAGSAMGRWSWSCASWDFDNDGWDDLYVANGFVSGPDRYDLQSFFWRQVAQRSMTPSGVSPDYELTWNAVNELVRSDYSWSGYQRNVFFANNRDGTFSDVSGILGLDLADDCRAYALSDFDHDGRLEFVLKNRTGPQVRLFRNNLEGLGNSVVFRLQGTKSNRDAIGAIVSIEAGSSKQTKFVSAGSGFASQHTKELFFGIGDTAQSLSVSVRWPNGAYEQHHDIPVNHRVEIVEGEKDCKTTEYSAPRHSPEISAPAFTPAASSKTMSTWLLAPLHGPDLSLRDLQGQERHISSHIGKPVLLTFVQAGCGASRRQLEMLQRALPAISGSGMAIFAVALKAGQDQAGISELARAAGINFPLYVAGEQAAGAWNIQYRYLFDRRRDISAPISFLLDTNGAVIRVYQGVVADPQDVLRDWKTAPQTPEDRVTRALPFRGPYYGGPMKHNYLTYGIAFVEYGYTDEAQAAFQRAVDAEPASEIAWFNLGTIYLNRKMYAEARDALGKAVKLNPQDSDAWNNLGMISGEEQKYDEALEQFRQAALANSDNALAIENMMRIYQFQGRAVEAQKTLQELIARAPQNADLHLGLAMALVAQNNLQQARTELETSIRLRPNNPEALNNLGAVLLRMGMADEALPRFEQSLQLAPDFDRPRINAALIYKAQGQPDRARQMLQDFLTRHPDDADVRSALNRMGTP